MAEVAQERLTPREAEVLAAVERRLTNAEIAAAHHVSVRTVESQIAALRRKLGVDSRHGLVTASRQRRRTALPVPQDSFVGRDEDLAAVQHRLRTGRWVTVVGPPGAGKTRTALEVAVRSDHVPVLVDLGHVLPTGVAGAVAKAAGVVADGSDAVAAAGVALSARPTLLILDNCDRVASEVAALVPRLLAYAPSLCVLGTSRAPVGVPGEALHALEPLPADGPDSPAARLFRDRCRAHGGPAAAEVPDAVVEQLCRRLDGLPLALELAAARVRHLGTEVPDRLAADLVPLAAAFDWTWDLLDAEEQQALSRLAALPLSFDLALAEAVGIPGAPGVVLRLLDRSLVVVADPEAPRRFRLLEPLRELVRARTDEALRHEVRRLHAEHYASVADEVHRRARTDDSHAAAVIAKRVCPEVNSAARWAVGREPHLLLRLVTALAVGGEQYGPDVTSLDTIARGARDERLRSVASPVDLLELGIALCYTDLALVDELAALALERAAESPTGRLAAHHLAGWAAAYAHRAAEALGHLDVAEALADELLEPWQLASARQARGIALRDLDDRVAALAAFEASMRAYALAGDALHVNNTRYMMAATAADEPGHEARVLSWAEQCIAYGRETSNELELAHGLLTRARVTSGARAAEDLESAMATFRAVGDLRCLTRSHLLLAGRRDPHDAVPLLEQALQFAARAHDQDRQATVLTRLVHARWAAGDQRGAALDLGRLSGLLGHEVAAERAPAALVEATRALGTLEPAVAEGLARGL